MFYVLDYIFALLHEQCQMNQTLLLGAERGFQLKIADRKLLITHYSLIARVFHARRLPARVSLEGQLGTITCENMKILA